MTQLCNSLVDVKGNHADVEGLPLVAITNVPRADAVVHFQFEHTAVECFVQFSQSLLKGTTKYASRALLI